MLLALLLAEPRDVQPVAKFFDVTAAQ